MPSMIPSQTLGFLRKQRANAILAAARAWRRLREHRPNFGLIIALLRSGNQRKPHSGACNEPQNILVIRLDAMGDVVMTTPIFRELKLRYPNATVTAVVQRGNSGLLETNPHVDRILYPSPVNKSRLVQQFRREYSVARLYWKFFRKERVDIAIRPALGPDIYGANFLLRLVNAPISLKYSDTPQRGLARKINTYAFRSMSSLPRPQPQHEVLSNLAAVEHLTGRRCASQPEIFLTERDRAFAKRFIGEAESHSAIVSVAFGAQARKRSWPLERWAEVIHLLAEHRAIFVLVICSEAERNDGEFLRAMLCVESRIVSGAALREAAACVEACDLFMGPDSGLAHLAAAAGCMPLVISPHPADGDPGHGNSPVRFAPYSKYSRVIQPETGSPPCESGCDAIEPHCILQISPAQVAQACEEMLRSPKRQMATVSMRRADVIS
jgi:ADP-heptose:LPS heptosyltransferase